jgi:hypothetical protein
VFSNDNYGTFQISSSREKNIKEHSSSVTIVHCNNWNKFTDLTATHSKLQIFPQKISLKNRISKLPVNKIDILFTGRDLNNSKNSNRYHQAFMVKSGSEIFSPPCIADSWASIPTQVMLADCLALGKGALFSMSAEINSCTRWGCDPP